MCNAHAVSGRWTGPILQWHINCLELLAAWLALKWFLPLIQGKNVLPCMDSTATAVYVNHQVAFAFGRCCNSPNASSSGVSRKWKVVTPSLRHAAHLGAVRACTDGPVCLPAHLPFSLWYSLTKAPLTTDAFALSWTQDKRKYAILPVSKVRKEEHQRKSCWLRPIGPTRLGSQS